jgi:hypothetical protein
MSIGQDELLLVERISQFKQSQCHTDLEYLIKTMVEFGSKQKKINLSQTFSYKK